RGDTPALDLSGRWSGGRVQRTRRHATARQAPIPPPVRHHKPCGSRAGTGHNLTKRAGVPASRHRLASDGAAMAGLPEVIGLLYRADWTRLSLSAHARFQPDPPL